MIQRIQTLFLALAALALIVLFFYPIATLTEFSEIQSKILETDYYNLKITGFSDPSPDSIPVMNRFVFIPAMVIVIMIIILIVYAIGRYKFRIHQLKLVKISIFLNIILVAGIFLNYQKIFTNGQIRIESGMGVYFPLISLVFLVIANRYILKDEKLVRSSDRLR